MKRYLFFLLYTIPFILSAQDTTLFRARYQEDYSRQLHRVITTSDTMPIDNVGRIYAFSIDGTIVQPKEDCFTRIVLEDIDGHDYLVAESDWFRNDTTIVELNHYCEETAMLDGIIPLRLKCYITGNATLTINEFHTSVQHRLGITQEDTKALHRIQVEKIVEKINSYNTKHNRHWVAGVTSVSVLPYDKLKKMIPFDCADSYSNNIIYYHGGLYEVGSPVAHRSSSNSQFVTSFDWRNRHGINWLTPVTSQCFSNYCTAFAAVAMLEANMNLYYNSKIDLDLSEQYVASYGGVSYTDGADRGVPIEFLKTDGTIDDASMPLVENEHYVAPATRPTGNEHVYLHDYDTLYTYTMPLDTLRKYIIQKGPGVCGYQRALPTTHQRTGGHAMNLVGYGTIEPDTTYYFFNGSDANQIYHEGDSIIGHTYWIYKNSWGPCWGHNGYMYIVYYNDDNWYMGQNAFFPKGKPLSNHTYQVVCEDRDHDGYYFWGIGPKPSSCPSWAPDLPDGDDSNYCKGPMDDYGFLLNIPDQIDDTIFIYQNTEWDQPRFLYSHVAIENGATLKISSQVTFYKDVTMTIREQSTLHINGGTLLNADIKNLSNNANVIKITNNGNINKRNGTEFFVPLGNELQFINGTIL